MRILLGAILFLAACSQTTTGDDATSATGDQADALDVHFGADVPTTADATADALTDAVADAAPDALADVTDAVTDVLTDSVADAAGDAAPDAIAPDVSQADVQPDAAPDATPDAVPDATDDATSDVALDAADDVTSDVPVVTTMTGCSDGSREGFGNQQNFPTIAACGGAWDQPGIFNMPAKCNRQGGNDGVNAAGTGCTVTDLCATGWHVCYGKDDVVFRNPNGCAGVMTGATPPVFFTTQMSSSGSFNCASGAAATNDLFGCGNLGCDFTGNTTCKALCSPLTLSSHDLCKGLRNDLSCGDWCNHLGKYPGAPNSWDCGTDGDKEALNVVKTHPEQQGGVLCCLD